MCVCAEIERDVGLVPHERAGVYSPDSFIDLAVEGAEFFIEQRTPFGVRAGGIFAAHERLIEDLVAEHVPVACEALSDMCPGGRVVVLQADAIRAGAVGPEVVKGALERGVDEVVVGKSGFRFVGQAIVLHRPVRESLALVLLVVHVLVEIQQRDELAACEQSDGLFDLFEVCIVVDAGLGLERLPDNPDADRVEAVRAQERRIVGVEPSRRGIVRRKLVDQVRAVQDHHAPARVGDPAARMRQRQRWGCLGRRWDRAAGHGGAEDQSPPGLRQLLPHRPFPSSLIIAPAQRAQAAPSGHHRQTPPPTAIFPTSGSFREELPTRTFTQPGAMRQPFAESDQ